MEMMRRGGAAGCPDQDHEPGAEPAGGDEAGFSVVAAGVRQGGVQPGEDPRGVGEVQPPLGQRFRALGRVEGDPHGISVGTGKGCGNICGDGNFWMGLG